MYAKVFFLIFIRGCPSLVSKKTSGANDSCAFVVGKIVAFRLKDASNLASNTSTWRLSYEETNGADGVYGGDLGDDGVFGHELFWHLGDGKSPGEWSERVGG